MSNRSMTFTKNDTRYTVSVDGVTIGSAYKRTDRTWSVRLISVPGDCFRGCGDTELVSGEATRTDALETLARWLDDNDYFVDLATQQQADDDLLASDPDAFYNA